jgi:hypothetical protein
MTVNFHSFLGSVNDHCAICLDPMSADPEPLIFHGVPPHVFHRACLERAAEENRRCPLCRKNIYFIQPSYTPNYSLQAVLWVLHRLLPEPWNLQVRGAMFEHFKNRYRNR